MKKSRYLALYWYRKAADQGNAPASFYLALHFEYGYGGVAKDTQRAIHYFEIAKGDTDPGKVSAATKELEYMKHKLEEHGNK